jgi:hypothetical protein
LQSYQAAGRALRPPPVFRLKMEAAVATCFICGEALRAPVSLSCGHMFCYPCWCEYLQTCRSISRGLDLVNTCMQAPRDEAVLRLLLPLLHAHADIQHWRSDSWLIRIIVISGEMTDEEVTRYGSRPSIPVSLDTPASPTRNPSPGPPLTPPPAASPATSPRPARARRVPAGYLDFGGKCIGHGKF